MKSFFGYKIAREIAEKSTVQCPHSNVKKYVLPFGFVQSPILASFCLHKSRLGVYLDKLYESGDFKVSVYMDDIIISGKNLEYLKEILVELNRISDHSGFQLNQKKTQIFSTIKSFVILYWASDGLNRKSFGRTTSTSSPYRDLNKISKD